MTIYRLVLFSAAAAGLLVLGLRITRAQQPAAYPPTQKLVMENQFVRVFEIRVPPGVKEVRHSHGRGLIITLSEFEGEATSYPEGNVTRRVNKFGEVRWAEPVTHEARNLGPGEQHVIRVELK